MAPATVLMVKSFSTRSRLWSGEKNGWNTLEVWNTDTTYTWVGISTLEMGGAKSPPYNNNPCRNNNPGGGLCVLLLVYRHADPFSLRRQNNWVDKLRQHVELSDGSIPAESDPVQAKSYKFRLVLYGYISHFFNKPVELGVSMLCSYSQRLMGCWANVFYLGTAKRNCTRGWAK